MIQRFRGHSPIIHPAARLAANATLVGCVTVEAASSIWYGAVLRDVARSTRAGSNIQDNAVLHCDADCPAVIGRDVTVVRRRSPTGQTVEDTCLIGMGAILLNGCTIGAGSLVAAGALVTQGAVIPPGSLVVGSPARVVRSLRPEEAAELLQSAETYRTLSAELLPTAEASETGGSLRTKKKGKIPGRYHKTLKEQVRENPRLAAVYVILRVLVVLALVAQVFNGNFENVFLCVLTLILFTIPSFIERTIRIDIPDTLVSSLFIFAAEILGGYSGSTTSSFPIGTPCSIPSTAFSARPSASPCWTFSEPG